MKKLRLIALVLALSLIFSGCSLLDSLLQEVKQEFGAPTGTAFRDMTYTRPDMAKLEASLESMRKLLDSSLPLSYVVDKIFVFYDLYDDFYTNLNLANIHFSRDITDSYWEGEYSYCMENMAVADAGLDSLYRMLASSKHRQELEKDEYFGPGWFDAYDGDTPYDEAYFALAQKEQALLDRYYAISGEALSTEPGSEAFYSQYGGELSRLYVELVALRQKIARHFGYNSYPEFAYDSSYYRDYTPGQASAYYEAIEKALYEPYRKANARDFWAPALAPCTEEETYAYLKNAAQKMGGDIWAAFTLMDSTGCYDIRWRENKQNMSYEIYLPSYHQPFIFTCPTQQHYDKLVFAHEFGHYCNDYVVGGSYAGTDVAEVMSSAMEFLTLCYTEDGEALERSKLMDALCIYVETAAYALFEQEVYNLKGDDLNTENVQALYEDIGTRFGFDSWAWDSRDYVTIPHLFTNPMYIGSYVVSIDVAFQIYQLEKQEPGAGLRVYEQCLASEDSFIVDFAEYYGLESPFAPGRLEAVRKTMEEELFGK